MRYDQMPIIRLELQGMKHAILHAFSEEQEEISKAVDAALEEMIRPENIAKIVRETIYAQSLSLIHI